MSTMTKHFGVVVDQDRGLMTTAEVKISSGSDGLTQHIIDSLNKVNILDDISQYVSSHKEEFLEADTV